MKTLSTILIMTLALNLFSQTDPADRHGKLLLNLDAISEQTGTLHVVLFAQPIGFPYTVENAFMHLTIDLADDNAAKEFTSIPYMQYAIITYYDENGNGELDRTWAGRAKEPVGFVTGVKQWNATYDNCAFDFSYNEQVIYLQLNNHDADPVQVSNNCVDGTCSIIY